MQRRDWAKGGVSQRSQETFAIWNKPIVFKYLCQLELPPRYDVAASWQILWHREISSRFDVDVFAYVDGKPQVMFSST